MKINLICFLFGHKISADDYYDRNNIQYCLRCEDTRSFYGIGDNFWSNWECYGILSYPLKKIWWKLKDFGYYLKDKFKKNEIFDDNIPF